MKKLVFSIIFGLLDIIFIVAGITCLIIASTANLISTQIEALFIIGWMGIGAGIGSVLAMLFVGFLASWVN